MKLEKKQFLTDEQIEQLLNHLVEDKKTSTSMFISVVMC